MGTLEKLRLYRDEYRAAMRDAEKAVGRRLALAVVAATAAVVTWILTRASSRRGD